MTREGRYSFNVVWLDSILGGDDEGFAIAGRHQRREVVNEVVERVARALAPAAWAALGTADTLAQKNRRQASLRHAKKAIAAMDRLSPEMLLVGARYAGFHTAAQGGHVQDFNHGWQAVIATLLEDHK